eukprot:751021-Hanusia_phi.AAC.1
MAGRGAEGLSERRKRSRERVGGRDQRCLFSVTKDKRRRQRLSAFKVKRGTGRGGGDMPVEWRFRGMRCLWTMTGGEGGGKQWRDERCQREMQQDSSRSR